MVSPLRALRAQRKDAATWAYIAAGAIAAYVFVAHGLECLFRPEDLIDIPRYVGMDDGLARAFLMLMGAVDIAVGILLFVKPSRILLAYASLWVLVPLYLQYVVQGQFEIVAKVMVWVAAALMIILAKRVRERTGG